LLLDNYLDRYKAQLPAEVPAHTIRITKPFAIGMFEVTVDQFIKFVAAEKYVTQTEKKGGGTGPNPERTMMVRLPEFTWKNTGFGQTRPGQPVCNVTWADAEAFCRWLSRKEKKTYRLPTEAEWEFACRAGTTTAWHFGNEASAADDYMH